MQFGMAMVREFQQRWGAEVLSYHVTPEGQVSVEIQVDVSRVRAAQPDRT